MKRYTEICNDETNTLTDTFIDKLIQVQQRIKPTRAHDDSIECTKCKPTKRFKLGNVIWFDTIIHRINDHHRYPSNHFVNVIDHSDIINGIIVNPPIAIPKNKKLVYVNVKKNNLHIIDALMNQGSYPAYQGDNRYLFSEHAGVMTLKNNQIDDVIVFTDTQRISISDDNILLPVNNNKLADHAIIFHTHPNTYTYAGRIQDGVIYELPSANDIFNFVKYRYEGKVQVSLVGSPEGIYIIRVIDWKRKVRFDMNTFFRLRESINKIEKHALYKALPVIKHLRDPDTFHKYVGSNMDHIKEYNKALRGTNLRLDYYPKEKINGSWTLRSINIQLVK